MAPDGVAIISVADGQWDGGAAGGCDFEEVSFVAEGDEFAVGGEGGLHDPAGLGLGECGSQAEDCSEGGEQFSHDCSLFAEDNKLEIEQG